jgi:dUTP pyrophosphatase
MDNVRVLTLQEVAGRLAVSLQTAYKLVRSGALRATKVGHEWRIDEDALDAYLGRGRATPAPAPPAGPAASAGAVTVEFVLDRAGARQPTQAYPGDAGWDLYASASLTVQPGRTARVHTGLRLGLPPGVWALILPRSSVAAQDALVHTGVVDYGYTGELYIIISNLTQEPLRIAAGDRIAQLAFHRYVEVRWAATEDLAMRSRGFAALGSSGT